MEANFDFVSFVIGLILGMIIMLLIVWITYFTRSFLFTYCPVGTRFCTSEDYYNDPGDALVRNPGLSTSQILFINGEKEMFYNRVPKGASCIPQNNQAIYIKYPQYCSFSNNQGEFDTAWKQSGYNSNIYRSDEFPGMYIETEGNCTPSPGSSMEFGIPLLRWDENPNPQ